MLIEPKTLAASYKVANLVEEFIANLVVEHGGAKSVSDLATGVARAGYDFRLDNVPIELKMTASWKIPVEIARDAAGQHPSGIATSTSEYVMVISPGHSSKLDATVAKVRLFPTKILLKEAMERPIDTRHFPSHSLTTSSLVHYVNSKQVPSEIYIGEFVCGTILPFTIDLSKFTPFKSGLTQLKSVLRLLSYKYK